MDSNTYMVTVMAEAGGEMDTQDVMVRVTDVDEMGTLVLSSTTPSVDAALTATLTDLDGMVSGETWMWYKSMDMTFMDDETVIEQCNVDELHAGRGRRRLLPDGHGDVHRRPSWPMMGQGGDGVTTSTDGG